MNGPAHQQYYRVRCLLTSALILTAAFAGALNAASWKDLVLKSRAELTAGESSVLIPLLLDARASFFVANLRPRIHEELNGRQ